MGVSPGIWVPDHSIIPPSPPAERRQARRRLLERELGTWTGRVLLPGAPEYDREIACLGTGIFYPGLAAVRREVMAAAAGAGPNITAPTAFYRLEDVADTGPNGLTLSQNDGGFPVTFGAGKISFCGQDFSAGSTHLSQYLTRADSAFLNPGSGNFSVWGWAYSDFLGSGRCFPIISKGGTWSAGSRQWMLAYQNGYFTAGGHWCLVASDNGTNNNGVYGDAASTGTWYFVAAWYDGANLNVSTNDGTVTQASYSLGVFAGSSDLKVGGPLDTWRGKLDAIAWWKGHALTTAEVTAGYNAGNGVEYYSGAWH